MGRSDARSGLGYQFRHHFSAARQMPTPSNDQGLLTVTVRFDEVPAVEEHVDCQCDGGGPEFTGLTGGAFRL
jgi:hypothetical protein